MIGVKWKRWTIGFAEGVYRYPKGIRRTTYRGLLSALCKSRCGGAPCASWQPAGIGDPYPRDIEDQRAFNVSCLATHLSGVIGSRVIAFVTGSLRLSGGGGVFKSPSTVWLFCTRGKRPFSFV